MKIHCFILPGMPRHACLALGFVCVLLSLPVTSFAAQGNRLVVTPLDDDLGRGGGDAAFANPVPGNPAPADPAPERLPGEPVPFFTQDPARQPPPGDASASGGAPTPVSGALQGEPPSYKDGVIMAYLVELMRKQGKPCPSGVQPPTPPSLLFSEPLCRVAESMGSGAEFTAASEQQKIYASRWRIFSAPDQPAQKVAMLLRAQHCEALLEPYTHIGAWRGNSGWRIILATVTEKPAAAPESAPQPMSQPAAQGDAPVPDPSAAASAQKNRPPN